MAKNLNRRMGVALTLVGVFGLGILWLYVSAGNGIDLRILAALLASVVLGAMLIQRNKPAPLPRGGRFRMLSGDGKKSGAVPVEIIEQEPVVMIEKPPPKKKPKRRGRSGRGRPERGKKNKQAQTPPEEPPPKEKPKRRGLFGRGKK